MRKRITIQEKLELIMECRNSGLSDYQWCKQRGLSPSTFYGYVKQVRKHNCEIPEPANLITYAPDDKTDIVKLEVVNDDSQPAYINQNDNKVIVPNCADFRTAFRKTIEKILKIELSNIKNYTNIQKKIMGNLLV